MIKLSSLIRFLIVGTVLSVGLWKRDAIEVRFHPVPDLDQSTPSFQNGLRLIRIEKPQNASAQLVLSAPTLPKVIPTQYSWAKKYSPPDAFRIEAQDSTGQSWHLGWNVFADGETPTNSPDGVLEGRCLIYVPIPNCFPPDFQWVDVKVKDHWGRNAIWRLTNLPRARESVKEPVKIFDSYMKDGVFIKAKATWSYLDREPHRTRQAQIIVSTDIKSSPTRRWEFANLRGQLQWTTLDEPPGDGSQDTGIKWLLGESPDARLSNILDGGPRSGGIGPMPDAYYPAENKYTRISLRLDEYATTGDAKQGGSLVSSTPLVFIVPIVDKGSLEARYPQLFGRKRTAVRKLNG